MTIYCPLAEALGIDPGGVSILDIQDRYNTCIKNGIIPSLRKGIPHTEETKEIIRQKKLGKSNGSHSEKTKKKIGLGNKGKVRTPEMKEIQRLKHLGKRCSHSEDSKKLIRQIALNRPRYECSVCGKKMTKQCFDRYGHGSNCKQERK
jgi:hypothetical protein